mgnify:CR=1 FL=1
MDDLDDRKLRGEYDGNIKVINKREVISPSKGYQTLQTMVADAVKMVSLISVYGMVASNTAHIVVHENYNHYLTST